MQSSTYYLVFTIFVVTICISNVFSRYLNCKHYLCKTHLQNSDESRSSSHDATIGSANIFTDPMQTEVIGGGQFVNMKQNRRCRNNFIGLKRHPFNEKYYYICQNDRIVVGKCKERFSPIYKQCITKENKTEPSTAPTECSISGIFPNPRDSQYYYTCEFVNDNFIKQNYKCPEDKIFEVAAKMCIEIQNPWTQMANSSLQENCSTEISSVKRLLKSLLPEKPPREVSKIIKKRKKDMGKYVPPSIFLYDSYKPKNFIDISSSDDSDSLSHSQYGSRCSAATYDPSGPRCLSYKNRGSTKPSNFERNHETDDGESNESSDKYDSSSENYEDNSNEESNNYNKGGTNSHNNKGSKGLWKNSKEVMDSESESQEKGTNSETNSESDMSIDDFITSENESNVSSDDRYELQNEFNIRETNKDTHEISETNNGSNRKINSSTEEENNFTNFTNMKNKSSDGIQNDSRPNENDESANEHNEVNEKRKKNDNNRPKVNKKRYNRRNRNKDTNPKDQSYNDTAATTNRENHHGLGVSTAANESDKDRNKNDNRREGTRTSRTSKPRANQEANSAIGSNNVMPSSNEQGNTDNNNSKIESDKIVEIDKSKEGTKFAKDNSIAYQNQNGSIKSDKNGDSIEEIRKGKCDNRATWKEKSERAEGNNVDFDEQNENPEENKSESLAISRFPNTEIEKSAIENSSNHGIETEESNHENTTLAEQPNYLPNTSIKTDEDLGDKGDNDPKITWGHYISSIKRANKNDMGVQTNKAPENKTDDETESNNGNTSKTDNHDTRLTTFRNENESSTDNNKENQCNKTDDNAKADDIKHTHRDKEPIKEYENDDSGLMEIKESDNQSENVSENYLPNPDNEADKGRANEDKTTDTGPNIDMCRPQNYMGTDKYSENGVEPPVEDVTDSNNIYKDKSNHEVDGGEISGPIGSGDRPDTNKEIAKDHSSNTDAPETSTDDNLPGHVENDDNTSELLRASFYNNKNKSSNDNSGRMVNPNTEDAGNTGGNNEKQETDFNSGSNKENDNNFRNNTNLENNSRTEDNIMDTNNPGDRNQNPDESNYYEPVDIKTESVIGQDTKTKNYSGDDATNTPDKVEETTSNTDAQNEQQNTDRNTNRDKTSENSTNDGTETNDDSNIKIDNPDTTITKNNESPTEINKENQGNETENKAEYENQEEKSKSESIGDLSKTNEDGTKPNGDTEPPGDYENNDSILAEDKEVDNNQSENFFENDNKNVSSEPDNIPNAGNKIEKYGPIEGKANDDGAYNEFKTNSTNLNQMHTPEKDREIDLYSEKGPEPALNEDNGTPKTKNEDGGNESNRSNEANDLFNTDREIEKDQKNKTDGDITTHRNKVSKIDAPNTSTHYNAPGYVENADSISDTENHSKPKSSDGTADDTIIDEKNMETDSTSGFGDKSEVKETNYEEVGNDELRIIIEAPGIKFEPAKETEKSPTINKNLENDRETEDNVEDQNNSGGQPDAIGDMPNSEPDKGRKTEIENNSKDVIEIENDKTNSNINDQNNLPTINTETDKDGDNSSTKLENKSDKGDGTNKAAQNRPEDYIVSNDDNSSTTNKPDYKPTIITNNNESSTDNSKENGDSEIDNSTEADRMNNAQNEENVESTNQSDKPDDGTELNSDNVPPSNYENDYNRLVKGKEVDNPNENVSEINGQNALAKRISFPKGGNEIYKNGFTEREANSNVNAYLNISDPKSKDEGKSEINTPSHINNVSKTDNPETPTDDNAPGYIGNGDNTSDQDNHNKNESSNGTTVEETDSINKSGLKNENKDMKTNDEDAANDELGITTQAPDINSEPNNENEQNSTINENLENESGTKNNIKDQNNSGDQNENPGGNNSDKRDVLSGLSNNKINKDGKSEIENSNDNIEIKDFWSGQDTIIKNDNDDSSKKDNDNSSSEQESGSHIGQEANKTSENRTNNGTASYEDNNSTNDKTDTEPPIIGNNNESSADNSKGNDDSETDYITKADNINEPQSKKDIESKKHSDKPDGNRSVDGAEPNNDYEPLENYENGDNEFVEIMEVDNQSDYVSENDSTIASDKPSSLPNATNETDNGSSNDGKAPDANSNNGSGTDADMDSVKATEPALVGNDYSINIFDANIKNEHETETIRPTEATETEMEIEKNQKDTTYTGDIPTPSNDVSKTSAHESSTDDKNTNSAPTFVENVDNTSGTDNHDKNESNKHNYIGTPDSDGNGDKLHVETEDEVYDADNYDDKAANGELESTTPPPDINTNNGNDSTKQEDESVEPPKFNNVASNGEISSDKPDDNRSVDGTEPNNDKEPLENYENDDNQFLEIKEVDNKSDDVSENDSKNASDKPDSLPNAANETDNWRSNEGKAIDGGSYNGSEPNKNIRKDTEADMDSAKSTEPTLDDNYYSINIFDTKVKNEHETETDRPTEATETEKEIGKNQKDSNYTGDIPIPSNDVSKTSDPETSTGDHNANSAPSFVENVDNSSGTDNHDKNESNKHNSIGTPDSDGIDGKPDIKTEDEVYDADNDDDKAATGELESTTAPHDINTNNGNDDNETDSDKQRNNVTEPAVEDNNKSINISDAKSKNKVKSESDKPNEAGILANIEVRLPLSILGVNTPTKQTKTESSKDNFNKTATPDSNDENDANDDTAENPDSETNDDTEPDNEEAETDSINENAESDNENENDDAGTDDAETTNLEGLVNSSNSTLKNSTKQNPTIPQNKPRIISGAVKDVVRILPILLR